MYFKAILLLLIAVYLQTTNCEDSTLQLFTSVTSNPLCNQSSEILHCRNNVPFIEILFIMTLKPKQAKSAVEIGDVAFGLDRSSELQQFSIVYREVPTNLDVNEFFCNTSHRQDYFCANCWDGHGIAIYTYYGLPCAPRCSGYGVAYYLLLEIGFSTLFFALVLAFGVSANSSKWNGYIFYNQIVAIAICSNPMVFALFTQWSPHLPAILHSVYGIWNMDYFRLAIAPFCVSETMSTFGAISCGYIAAVWPLLLILLLSFTMALYQRNIKVVVIFWQVINRMSCGRIQQHLAETNLIHVFATFFLLSYLKALFVSFSILQINNTWEIESKTGL